MDSGLTPVSELGERGIIERIRARIPPQPSWVVIGIGDDAAVIEPERNTLEVITTDALVEGVHFDCAFVAPEDIGHKALAVNLSDLAAMGAAPRAALLSLMLPPPGRWRISTRCWTACWRWPSARAFLWLAVTLPAPPARSSSTSRLPAQSIGGGF